VVYTDAVQLKVSVMKTVVFSAVANRHLDFFVNVFDYLAPEIITGPPRALRIHHRLSYYCPCRLRRQCF
jgi:hypothetical protein